MPARNGIPLPARVIVAVVVTATILMLAGRQPATASAARPAMQTGPLAAAATGPAPSPPQVATPALPCTTRPSGAMANAAGYKREVACRIHARNGGHLYEGAPPPVLRSIVVLTVRIDAAGRPVRIGVLRSNGIRELERRAIQSVRTAAPLPLPRGTMLRQGTTDIVETWLFRDDGRFQVRTLASVQAESGY